MAFPIRKGVARSLRCVVAAVLCMVAGGKGHDIPGADAGAFHAIIIHDKAEIRVQVCQRAGGLVVAHADAPSFSIRCLA